MSHIGRYFDTLELLLGQPEGLSLSDISASTGVAMATTHRILSILRERGYVVQDNADRYRLTLKIPSMGVNYITETGFAALMQPLLDDLAAKTGEHVRLAATTGNQLTWVLHATAKSNGLQYRGTLNATIIPHTTAAGKAWLSTMRDEDAMRILAPWDIEKSRDYAGPKARTSLRDVLDDMAIARRDGYAIVREEGEIGVCVVAVAVFGSDAPAASEPVGTLSVAGPLARMRKETIEGHVANLQDTAREIGRRWSLWYAVAPKGPSLSA